MVLVEIRWDSTSEDRIGSLANLVEVPLISRFRNEHGLVYQACGWQLEFRIRFLRHEGGCSLAQWRRWLLRSSLSGHR